MLRHNPRPLKLPYPLHLVDPLHLLFRPALSVTVYDSTKSRPATTAMILLKRLAWRLMTSTLGILPLRATAQVYNGTSLFASESRDTQLPSVPARLYL
ncbi:unnamed protein product [Penicillium egyptiacum]|uniref:Uncharacterized protein n=1 Tax=Penicillium egyptiacum TaxID=1303716 RepID=A0A9W4KPN5_9EURO|nr:unnamed protein product [Penicillium egyptiacum]